MSRPSDFVVVAKPAGSGDAAPAGGDGGGGGALACCCCMRTCAYDPSAPRELRRCACWRRASCRWRCGYCCCAGAGVFALVLVALCIAVTAAKSVDCKATPGYAPGDNARNVPVIYVQSQGGGYLDKGGRRVYMDWQSALGLGADGNTDISLPGTWQGSVADAADPSLFYQTRDGVTVENGEGGLLKDVCLGCLYCFDVLQTFVSWTQTCMNRPIHFFTYDWRRDQYEAFTRFRAFARSVSLAHGQSKVQIVGFSTGASLGLALLNVEPGLVHSAVFVSAAYSPGLSQARYMGSGAGDGSWGLANRNKWFPFSSYWTMALPYGFLALAPGDRRWANGVVKSFKDSVTGSDVPLDLSSAQTWLDYGLMPFSAGDPRVAVLSNILLRSRMLRELLQPNASVAYPPTAVITSVLGTMTGGSGNYSVNVAAKTIDWTATGPSPTGDGAVCTACAMPPYPVGANRVFYSKSGFTHRQMMLDMTAMKSAMDSVGPYPTAPILATFA